MNMHSKLLNSHSVHPPYSDGDGVEPPTKFSKRRGLTGLQLLQWVCSERGGDFIQGLRGGGGCSFHIKINQNLKYLMAKTLMSKNIFLCHN